MGLREEDVEGGVEEEVIRATDERPVPNLDDDLLDFVEQIRVGVDQAQNRTPIVVALPNQRPENPL